MIKKNLNILQVVGYPSLARGAAIQAYRLGKELYKRGHRVTFVFNNKHKHVNRNNLEKIEQGGMRLKLYKMNFLNVLHFRQFLIRERFDVIHAHFRDTALRFVLAASLGFDIPVLIANWGNTRNIRKRYITKSVLKSKKVDKIVAMARAAKETLIYTGSLSPSKIGVIYGGVDPDEFHPHINGLPIKREFNIGLYTPVIGMVAANYWRKDFETFLHSAAIILKKINEAHFIIVGEGVEHSSRQLVRELRLLDNITFEGFREDIAQVIASFDVSVSSAMLGEAINGAIRESLAMAKPVVCTNVGGNSELAIHRKTGLLVPPKDPQAMAASILELLINRKTAKFLGVNGRELVLKQFTNAHRCNRVENLYRNILIQKKSSKDFYNLKWKILNLL